jgi:hypothetical protein
MTHVETQFDRQWLLKLEEPSVDRSSRMVPLTVWAISLGVLLIVLLKFIVPPSLLLLFAPDQIQHVETLQEFVGTLAQVLSEILGFSISVVAIVVQLYASRFTPKVTELFLREKVNFFVILFLIVANLVSLWTSLAFSFFEKPILLVWLNLVLGTLSFVILIPYFTFLFNFLKPDSIIKKIEEQIRHNITIFATKTQNKNSVIAAHRLSLLTLDEFKGIAANAIQQRESTVMLESLDSLKRILLAYEEYKEKLIEDWFVITQPICHDSDFVSLEEITLKKIEAQKIWLEVKILKQYQTIFLDSLNQFRAACYVIAINTREIVEQSLEKENLEIVQLAIKFFNTYLRAAISQKDQRVGYTLVKEYRLIAEVALKYKQDAIVLNIAHYFSYYCLLAYKEEVYFLPETFAFDLGLLAQKCCQENSEIMVEVLDIFLKIDRDPESEHQENTLRGIRKSQVKLAVYYLSTGHDKLAEIIFKDMKDETDAKLKVIESELHCSPTDFWEFRDRGGENFYYVEPELKPYLSKFLSWFEQ